MGKNRPRRSAFGLAAFMRTRLGGTLAALALAIQCFVVQTHIDGLALQAPAHVEASVNASSPDSTSAPVCLICQEAALARTALIGGAPTIQLVEHTLFLGSAPPRRVVIEARPSLPWQSRAPPAFA